MNSAATVAALSLYAAVAQAQWIPATSGTTNEMRGLSVVSKNVVWASGQRGTIVRTTDGGRTWITDTIPGASKLDLRSIAATSASVAHALSIADSGRVFRTTDSGRTWKSQLVGQRKGSFFDAIQFWDAKHGIAVSDPVDGKFLFITTSDGGETWQEVPAAALPDALPNEGGFAASGSCLTVYGKRDVWFATGGASVARVYHSWDRGKSWRVYDTPIRAGIASAGAFSIAFRDGMHGVIAGGDYTQAALGGRNVALTTDGGRTWTLVDSAAAPGGFRSAVTYVPGTKGKVLVAVGLNGTDISRDGGRRWTKTDSTAYNSVLFAGRDAGFVVGPRGRVARGAIPK